MTGSKQKFTKEFRREAVRLSRESGRTVRDIAEDLGVGMSTLSKWRAVDADQEPAPPHDDPHKELARLRRENEILRQERDLLKKATAFFAAETKR
jgi:transposase